jgi:hypothetical protein
LGYRVHAMSPARLKTIIIFFALSHSHLTQ